MAITYTQTEFQRMYGSPEGTYSRAFWNSFGGTDSDGSPRYWRNLYEQRIVPAIGTVTGAQRILFVGCGLGLGVERVIDSGFAPSTWGIDNSSYIQGLWPTQARSDIRTRLGALDIRSATATQFRTLTGINNVRFTLIITEDVLSSYTTAELQSTSASVNPLVACRNWLAPSGKIIHLIMTSGGSSPDMTRWPAGRFNLATNDWETWSAPPGGQGALLSSPGSPPRTMSEWQSLVGSDTAVSMEGI